MLKPPMVLTCETERNDSVFLPSDLSSSIGSSNKQKKKARKTIHQASLARIEVKTKKTRENDFYKAARKEATTLLAAMRELAQLQADNQLKQLHNKCKEHKQQLDQAGFNAAVFDARIAVARHPERIQGFEEQVQAFVNGGGFRQTANGMSGRSILLIRKL